MNFFDYMANGKCTRLQMQRFLDKESSEFPEKMMKMDKIPESNPKPFAVYRSRKFLVQVFAEKNDIIRLSINRSKIHKNGKQWMDGIKWDDIQRIKKEVGYGDRCAVEIYPPDDCVVNVANLRHIFILIDPPEFMWRNSH